MVSGGGLRFGGYARVAAVALCVGVPDPAKGSHVAELVDAVGPVGMWR